MSRPQHACASASAVARSVFFFPPPPFRSGLPPLGRPWAGFPRWAPGGGAPALGMADLLSHRSPPAPELALERVVGTDARLAPVLSLPWSAVACAWDPWDASIAAVAEKTGAVRTMRVGPTGAATLAVYALTRRRLVDRGAAAGAERDGSAVTVEHATADESFAWGGVPSRPWVQMAFLANAEGTPAARPSNSPLLFFQKDSNKLLFAHLPAGTDARPSALAKDRAWSTVYCFARHPFRITAFAVSPAGSRVATSCEDGSIRVYRASDAAHVASAPTSLMPLPAGGLRPASASGLAFAGERAFVAGTENGGVRLWALPADAEVAGADVFADAWGEHADRAAGAGLAAQPQMHPGSSAPQPLDGRPSCTVLAKFLDDTDVGSISCVAAHEGAHMPGLAEAAFANPNEASLLAALRHGERAPAVAAGACRLVAAGTEDGILHAWMFLPSSSGKTPLVSEAKWKLVCVAHQARGHGLTSVAFSPSGSALAAASPSGGGCHGGVVRLYDTRTWRVARAYDVTSAVVAACFRPPALSAVPQATDAATAAVPVPARRADHPDTLLVCGRTSRPRLVEGARLMCTALSEQPGWARDGGVFALEQDGYSLEFAQSRYEQLETEQAGGAMDAFELRSPGPPSRAAAAAAAAAAEVDGGDEYGANDEGAGDVGRVADALPAMPRLAAMRGLSPARALEISEESRAAAAEMLARAPKTAKHIAEAREAAKAAEVAADVVEAVASAGLHDELREVFGEEGGKEGEEGEAREEAAPRLATPVPSVPGIRRHAVRASAENAPRDAPPPAPTSRMAAHEAPVARAAAPRPRAAPPPVPATAVEPPQRRAAVAAKAPLAEAAPGAATAALARRVAAVEASLRTGAPAPPLAPPSEDAVRAAATAATTRRRCEAAYDASALPAIADPTAPAPAPPKLVAKQLHPRWAAKYAGAAAATRAPRLRDPRLYGRDARAPTVNTCEAAPITPPMSGSVALADAARTLLLGL